MLEVERERLKRLCELPAIDPDTLRSFRILATDFNAMWEEMTMQEKKEVCRLVFADVKMEGREWAGVGLRKTIVVNRLHEPFESLLNGM